MRRIFLLFFTAISCVASLWAAQPFGGPQRPDIKWFYEAIKTADSLEVLEGLPHQYWEPEIRAVEAAKPDIVDIAGELFYPKPLDVSIEQKNQLTEKFLQETLLTVPDSNAPVFPKGCGGFHADYALRWTKNGSAVAAALVCFGCEEILLVSEKAKVSSNFTGEGKSYLPPALKPLRQSRPASKFGAVRLVNPDIFQPSLPLKTDSPGKKK